MQGKGLIKIILVALILVSLLQVFYVLPTRKVERDADAYAESSVSADAADKETLLKNARFSYLDSMSSESIFSIPMIGSYTYDDLKKRQLAFGLDLKGGMSSVLQVDLKELLVNLAGNTKDQYFRTAIDNAVKAQESSQSDFVSLFAQEYNKLKGEDKRSLSKIFMRDASLREEINANTTDGEVVRMLRTKADETVRLTFNMLKQRINKLGVAQPSISLDAGRDLILVELPGIENPQRARNMLQATADLGFYNTYRINEIGNLFSRADEVLKRNSGDTTSVQKEIVYDTIWTPELDNIGNATGDSTFQLVAQNIDPFGDQGPLLSKMDINTGALAPTIMALVDRNKVKAVDKMLQSDEVKALMPGDMGLRWSRKPHKEYSTGEITNQYALYAIKKTGGSNKAPIEGDVVVKASQSPDATTGEIKVNLKMNSNGAKKWGEMTTKAAQAGNREIAILLDGEVVSAPSVNEPILGGSSEISGNFTVQEAADFASVLEVGKLPASPKSIQESTVGPSLGKENIRSSIQALLFGFGLLLLFMVAYYGTSGIVSIIALLLNLFFIFGALASFGTVLTVPGIAGIVLTIGMAVDANVIIYERIKEELRAGKSTVAAISDGFKNSYSAIIDANVTTILVAIILAWFGLGPIKGFAVVLIIGVISSLFTAVLLGRMIIDWWTQGGRNISFWTGPTKNVFANLNIDWIGKRKIAYVISLSIIGAGLVSMMTRGFDLGVDFKGGYSYNVEFAEGLNVSAENLRGLSDHLEGSLVVKAVDTKNTFNIVTSHKINDNSDGAADQVASDLLTGLAAVAGVNVSGEDFKNTNSVGKTHIVSSSKVGPTIADDIKKSSYYAGTFALLMIFLYIFVRFSKWQYSLGAVAALVHDSLIVLGLFSLLHGIVPFSLEIDQPFIAAILTVIGYSINDTVVVFDRIREYLGIYTKKSSDEILNLAINSTFSRTLVTSLTTLLVVGILFVFGGSSIKGFAFALLIGIVVGTYSSIFVATPIVRDFSDELKSTKKVDSKKSFGRSAKTVS